MTSQSTLLVVDDEPSIIVAIQKVFRGSSYQIIAATSVEEAVGKSTDSLIDVAILDVHLPDGSGLELFSHIKKMDPRIPVILMTGHATNETAIEAMRQGAFDYIFKPLDAHSLREIVGKANRVSRAQREPVKLLTAFREPTTDDVRPIIGNSAAMREIYKSIGRVAADDVTVLITGESGVGKELVARAIYQHSGRSGQMFMPVNCAAIPETLLESEMFGYEKNAFTGANNRRIGKFEQCNGGTLFLDEVGDMTAVTQAKLLRVIEERSFERVGGNQTIETDLRLIAATNCNLPKMIEEGEFREDLYYRLSGFHIHIPPLRERKDDIPELVKYLLYQLNADMNREIHDVSEAGMQRLQNYAWPGNVRELQSYVRRWMLVTNGPCLSEDQMPELGTAPVGSIAASPNDELVSTEALHSFIDGRLDSESLHAEFIDLVESELFKMVLERTAGNLSKAARILGINRRTLRTKLQALGLKPDDLE